MASNSEKLTSALCALTASERLILVEFWDGKRRGQAVSAASLLDLSRPRTHKAVSASFVKYRELGILRTGKIRLCYWPRHHAPTDFGLQVLALILGTQREAN